MLIITMHVCVKHSGGKTAVRQAELLLAHLTQTVGLVPMTVSFLQ